MPGALAALESENQRPVIVSVSRRNGDGDADSGADPRTKACPECHQQRALTIAAHLLPAFT